MYFIYNIAVYIASIIAKIIAGFNNKFALFVNGRKDVFTKLKNCFDEGDKVIWFHCASLGEFEQGRPIIEKCKDNFGNYKILVTFFSPSGYEVRKNYAVVDLVTYLPLDTKKNVKKFIKIVDPVMAIFVKYEFWPNLLRELKDKQIKTILVSGIFRENQSFFKDYGGWMRKSLTSFDHFFVQNKLSLNLLKKIGFHNVTLSGDTRFDRVYEITKQKVKLDFVDQFKDNKTTLIAGSTWPKDEALLVGYINKHSKVENEKYIIAPHNINPQNIEKLKQRINRKVVRYSERENKDLSQFEVLIIDTIGILTQVYKYGDIAYVGGGFGTGIHNILEAATFGIPIIIGPNFQKFNEAIDLAQLGACIVVKDRESFNSQLKLMFNNLGSRETMGHIAKDYIIANKGATKQIIDYVLRTI